MSARRARSDVAASVVARLRALARERGLEFQRVLSEFAIERLLYRLGVSPHAERFVLKGATLFRLWSEAPQRATWDLDLHGRGASGVDDVAAVVRELCEIEVADAIRFDARTIVGEAMRVPDEYAGVRVRLVSGLAEARIPVQLDVGFGDAIVPAPTREDFPTLLGHSAPRILVYPREAVVAEKLEAMVSLGVTNSRMKDFYDVRHLATAFPFEGPRLAKAIRATFARRGTAFPDGGPLVLAPGFLAAPERQTQWRALLRRGRLEGPLDARALTEDLRRFALPVMDAAATGGPFDSHWPPGGPWLERKEARAR